MSRNLPIKRSPKQKVIIEAVNDYFGEGCSPADRKLRKNIALWLMGRKTGLEKLNSEQKEAVEDIRTNLMFRSASVL